MDVRTLLAAAILTTAIAVIVAALRTDRPGKPKDGPWYDEE